jgi:hypothetical protein
MNEIDGPIYPGTTLIERYDFLAALVSQLHRHAAEGLVGIMGQREALERILHDSLEPCCAKVTVRRLDRAMLVDR